MDLFTAAESRDRAMAQVAENAGPIWRDVALEAIRSVARRQPTLTTDDVWDVLEVKPHNPKAMGPAMNAARDAGYIVNSNLPSRATKRANARRLNVWASLLYRPNAYEAAGREKKAHVLARAVLRLCPNRPPRSLADAAERMSPEWWRQTAEMVEVTPPSEATVLRVAEILRSEAAA